jgi:hypothetical protein
MPASLVKLLCGILLVNRINTFDSLIQTSIILALLKSLRISLATSYTIPANTDTSREERTVPIKCEYREGDTIKAVVNTINRAELAAIKVAQEVAPDELLLLPDHATTVAADIDEVISSIYE